MKKKYLIDVPVQINIWVRPQCQKKQLEVLQKARPSVVFLVSDGGRNRDEWEKIRQNRKMLENGIDWECVIYRLYETENLGVKKMIMKTHEFVWSKADRCIFLEDDIIPAVSFFQYCKELLDRYENDYRISVICGMNHLGVYQDAESDYFFSRQGSIWGYALWKRTYETFYNYGYERDSYVWKLLKHAVKEDKIFWKIINQIKADKNMTFSPMEYFMDLSVYAQNQLVIVPKRNMICCMGATKSSHGADSLQRLPKAVQKIFFMKTHEAAFPLNHPQFVIPDTGYEKKRNRIVARNHPLIQLKRKIERGWYVLMEGDFSYLWKKTGGMK